MCGAGRALGYINASSIFQLMVAECIGETVDISRYEYNRDFIYGALTELGFSCVRPDGAFYLFVKAPGGDSRDFCRRAMEHNILLIPGDEFGRGGYARLAYCVTPERLHFMAQAVQQYHVPFLKLTTCEAIQMHDLTPDEVPAIMEAAIPCGIITRGGGGDNPRNIQASPLTGVQPGEAFDVMPWAEAATEYLLSICRDIHMPRKLKVAFCNGVDDCVHTAFRDMGFVAQPDGTFKLYIAGGLGGGWRMGILAAESLPAEDVLYYIRGMITTFCQHGNYQNRAKARTRFMQETLGPDELRHVFLENVAAAKADESLKLHLTPAAITKTGTGTLDDPRAIAQKQPGLYAVAYHPIGGRLIPEKLVQLDNLLSTIPGCECRVAPNETLYIINLTADEAAAVLDATADGAKTLFETSVACIGASICQQGVRDSQSVLQRAVQAVREANIPDGALPKVCISGCTSSCSGHQAAAIGFQGTVKAVPGGKPAPAFAIFLGGSDALGHAHFGDTIGTVYEEQLPALLVELGQAHLVRVLDDEGVHVGDVDAGLDDGGADQDVRLPVHHGLHDGGQLLLRHLPVAGDDADLRPQHLLEPGGGGVDALHPVVEVVYLAAPAQLPADGILNDGPVVLQHIGLHRLAV